VYSELEVNKSKEAHQNGKGSREPWHALRALVLVVGYRPHSLHERIQNNLDVKMSEY